MNFFIVSAVIIPVIAVEVEEEKPKKYVDDYWNRQILDDEIIDLINIRGDWKAGRHNMFENKTLLNVRHLFSTKLKDRNATISSNSISDNFDSRQKWGQCIHPIRDQEQCGSCWAFGATETLSDRFCINGGIDVILSPQDLVSCDTQDHGCNGGQLETAWSYMSKQGVCIDNCLPYTSGSGSTSECTDKCVFGDEKIYYKSDGTTIFSSSVVIDIQNEIMNFGPIEVGFEVYQDFMQYQSGVYHHVTGKLLGGHAVKLIGWGVENGVPYWICANSWGSNWGESGYFLIRRGNDECAIESNTYAERPLSNEIIDECDLCEYFFHELELVLGDKKTEEEIIKGLDYLCTKTSKFESVCTDIVENFLSEVIDFVIKEFTPEMICNKIGFCNNKLSFVAKGHDYDEECFSHEIGSRIVNILFKCLTNTGDKCMDSLKQCADYETEDGFSCCECLPGGFKYTCESMIIEGN